MGRRTDSLR